MLIYAFLLPANLLTRTWWLSVFEHSLYETWFYSIPNYTILNIDNIVDGRSKGEKNKEPKRGDVICEMPS